MADFRGYVTAAGQTFEALAKQMGYPVTIGFIEVGDGKLPDSESPIDRTQLVHKLKQFPAIVEQDAKNPGQWVATCYIPADDAIDDAGYFIREIGCKLINQGNGVLYAYRRVSDDWKPVITSGEAKSFIYKLRFIPSNGELLTPTIDPSVVLVDKEELARVMKAHVESRNHPDASETEKGFSRHATSLEINEKKGSSPGKNAVVTVERLWDWASNGSGLGSNIFLLWKRSMADSGYDLIGEFGQSLELKIPSQAVLYRDSNKVFRWSGDLPKNIENDELPIANDWIDITGEILREELSSRWGAGLIGGLPVFVTSKKYSGGADASSDNNDEAIKQAIAEAIETGNFVYWPQVYEVKGSIRDIHKVRHMGPGGIKRGDNTLYFDKMDDLGFLYASVTGSIDGDGITAEHPMTLDDALIAAQLRVASNKMSRTWIYLSDGDYPPASSNARWKVGGMKWFTRLIASDPSKCSIDGGGASYNLFHARGAGAKLWLENIHLRNTGGASATASEGAIIQLVNCDQTDCFFGLTGNSHSEIYMSGGIHRFTPGFAGYSLVRSMFLVKHSIGYKYDEDLGYAVADQRGSCPKFYGEGLGRGMLGQEHSTGHVRLDVIDNFSKGLELVSSSRAHLEDTLKVTRCGVGAEVENGCNMFDAGVDWTTRGTGKNSISIRYLGGVRISENSNQGSVRQRLGFKDMNSKEVSSTQEVILGLNFPTDGISNNIGCTYTVRLTGSISGTSGKKTLRLLFSGSGYVTSLIFPSAATGPFTLEFGFIKTDGDFVLPFGLGVASGLSASAGAAEGTSASAPINRIIDTGSPGYLDVGAAVESLGDTIVFNSATLHFEG